MSTDPESTIAASGSSGPSTVFMPGDERLADRRMGAVTPEQMVWAHGSLNGLTEAAIMMVDDEPLNIEMTEAFLEDAGYRHFVSTTQSEQAVELMRSRRPSLLLLDLSMPKVSGMQILKVMRDDPVLRHVPVIVLTSTHDPQVKLHALSLGAMDFLSKPVDPSELALRIRNTLAATVYRDYLAEHDPLTTLPNKLRYKEAVKTALARPAQRRAKGALIHIGVDQLASVNDAMGRAVGDQLMQRISKRLASCVEAEAADAGAGADDRPTLYRFDGDEFAVLVPQMESVETTADFINRLLDAASTSFNRGGSQEIFVTCSIGVAVFPDDGDEIDSLVTNAGLAMRHAKSSGRHTYEFFSGELNEKAVRSLTRGADLRAAFTREQVEVLYQPRLHTLTGSLAGAQAVVRWIHPSGEVFEGDAVLNMATTAEMSMALAEWTLGQLRDQNKEWRAAALRLPRVGVPVSLDLLALPHLVDILRKSIRAGLQPQYLSVELRDGADLQPTPDNLEALAGLKKMGVHFVLDHFGGAGSSLLQVGRLPADEVKLHQQFFREAGNAPLAGAMLDMARSMHLRTVATGIETERQLALLEEKRCDEYQGPLAGPPLKAAAFARKWMSAQS
ncbi:EAL domain-containing protein [Caenimonas terrae]|uniref:EAL domain-containing protein n=1 Tax=Caenimonas terrae TaxID=696074 RepID=A0ABW0NMI8_9BURK